jgi:hypothetical protein
MSAGKKVPMSSLLAKHSQTAGHRAFKWSMIVVQTLGNPAGQ